MTQEHDARMDEVVETWHEREMGIKVERAHRKGFEVDQGILKVYRKTQETYASLETGEPQETTRWVKIAEFPTRTATEVLYGLAEAYEKDLVPK